MAGVELRIGGRRYEIGCKAGEEAHFRRLGELVDGKAGEAARALGGLTESRQLLYAALLLADELAAASAPAPPAPEIDQGVATAIERLAGRLEALAETLEAGPASA